MHATDSPSSPLSKRARFHASGTDIDTGIDVDVTMYNPTPTSVTNNSSTTVPTQRLHGHRGTLTHAFYCTDASTASPAVLPNNFSVLGEMPPANNETHNDAAVHLDSSRNRINHQLFNSTCFKPLCACKNPSKTERIKVGKAKSIHANWVIVQSISIPPKYHENQDEIFRIINDKANDFINQGWRKKERDVKKKWHAQELSILLHCPRRDLGDCNASIKICFTPPMNAVHVKWFTKSNAHGMSELMIHFETIEDHDIFTHELVKSTQTFVLPLNIRDWIVGNVGRFPEKKPSNLIEHCKLVFPSHPNNFWIMAHGPIMSLRRTVKRKMKLVSEQLTPLNK